MARKRKRPRSFRKYAPGGFPWYRARVWQPLEWIRAVRRRQRAEAKAQRPVRSKHIKRHIGR